MKKFIEEFKKFALRGNVMDMAVGVTSAAHSPGIVTARRRISSIRCYR